MGLYHSLDFDATNPFRSLIPLTRAQRYGDTSDSDASIPYLQSYPDYREQFTSDGGSYGQATLAVRWADVNDFVNFVLGYTLWDGSVADRFERWPAMISGYSPHLRAQSCSWKACGMLNGNDHGRLSVQPFWFHADWVSYDVVFRPLNETIYTDGTLDTPETGTEAEAFKTYGCKELARYVVRTTRFVAEERKIGLYGFATYNAATNAELTTIPEPTFIPFKRRELVYTWRQIPWLGIPWDAIDRCAVRVNGITPQIAYGDATTETDATLGGFDVRAKFDGTGYERVFPAGTLLFKGLAEPVEQYVGIGGERYADLKYLFSFNPFGWNNQPTNDPNSTAVNPVRRRRADNTYPPNDRPYGEADFRALFKPRAA